MRSGACASLGEMTNAAHWRVPGEDALHAPLGRLWRGQHPRRRRSIANVGLYGNWAGNASAASRSRLAHRAHPLILELNHMGNFTLTYGISKRTPASPKALREILDAQAAVNAACTWTHERLALAAPRDMGRATFAFPLVRFGLANGTTPGPSDGFGAASPVPSADAFAQGSTRVRENLWNAHLVAAFLRHVSRMHPTLLLELRDEGGFVVPGSVWIKSGVVEANREYLNRERARALELTGDPQAAARLGGTPGSRRIVLPGHRGIRLRGSAGDQGSCKLGQARSHELGRSGLARRGTRGEGWRSGHGLT
jgi:hypothetical protein